MEFGIHQPKDGSWHNLVGSAETTDLTWHCTAVKRMLNEMSKDLSTQINMRSENMGHDAGDEDPNAWS